ncbi:hypothetical protein GKC56_05450 [Neisseriaceae bacterium PsAf]|nr:hypothetical protein [Neisseriaceae bacterium PsAf]
MKKNKEQKRPKIESNLWLEDFIPGYKSHLTEEIVYLTDKKVMCVFEFQGLPFESIEDETLVKQFFKLNHFLVNFGKTYENRLELWLQYKRENIEFNQEYEFTNYFTERLTNNYISILKKNKFYKNTFYISFVLKVSEYGVSSTINELKDLINDVNDLFIMYSPRLLTSYENENGVLFSEIYEYLHFIIQLEKKQMPITDMYAKKTIFDSPMYFSHDVFEVRNDDNTKYGQIYELLDYGVTKIKVLEDILRIPAEFTFTQIFKFKNRNEILSVIDKQLNNLSNEYSYLQKQKQELIDAKSDIEASELYFGQYGANIVVYSDNVKDLIKKGSLVNSTFQKTNGYKFVRCTIEQPNVLFSSLPGAKKIVRDLSKSTINLSSTFPMQNFATGKAELNPLGDGTGLLPLKSTSDTLYYYNIQYSPINEDSRGKKYPGHNLFLGNTGTGKTVLVAVILSFLDRFNPYIFSIDYKSGMEIFFKAIKGNYFTFEKGAPTGLNPFQLPDTEKTRDFLKSLMEILGRGKKSDELSSLQRRAISEAVDITMNSSFEIRNFKTFYQAIINGELKDNLYIWTNESKQYGWVFDNPVNEFDPDNFYRIGFDCVNILIDNYLPTEPILATLMYMKELMLKKVNEAKSFLITIIEEFWYATKFQITRDIIEDVLNTGRRGNEHMFLISQSPSQAIKSAIFETIVERTSTKIFIANPDASYKNNYELCGITKKEFNTIKDFVETERKFLIKQGNTSVVSKLELTKENEKGFKEIIPEMKVISTSLENVEIVNELIDKYGLNSDEWVKEFLNEY